MQRKFLVSFPLVHISGQRNENTRTHRTKTTTKRKIEKQAFSVLPFLALWCRVRHTQNWYFFVFVVLFNLFILSSSPSSSFSFFFARRWNCVCVFAAVSTHYRMLATSKSMFVCNDRGACKLDSILSIICMHAQCRSQYDQRVQAHFFICYISIIVDYTHKITQTNVNIFDSDSFFFSRH